MNKGVLYKSERDPLAGHSKESMEILLRKKLSGRVLHAWTFGSINTNLLSNDSDIDLILVKETRTPFTLRSREFFDLLNITRMDILVYTPKELDEQLESNIGFWKSVKESMKQIL